VSIHSINYYNRYTKKIEEEAVYGEKLLKWAYGTILGKATVFLLFKRIWLSRWYGWLMDQERSQKKIQPFINHYNVDVSEFEKKPEEFKTFNEFFTRKLKPEIRPIKKDPEVIVFPADGRHLGFQDVSKVKGIFVKGQQFDLKGLLNDEKEYEYFKEGTLVLSRLCPTDYHRFHFPVDGTPGMIYLVEGSLRSVNPMALRQSIEILSQNRRMITKMVTENMGRVLIIEIGASAVGSIVQTFAMTKPVKKGQEKGYFRFGGSSVITLFEKGRIKLAEDLIEQTMQCRELYAHMGDIMGKMQA